MYDLENLDYESDAEDQTIRHQLESVIELASVVQGRLLTEDEVRATIFEIWVAGIDMYKAYLAGLLDDEEQGDLLRSTWGAEPFTGIREC